MSRVISALLVLTSLLLAGCSSAVRSRGEYIAAYHHGNLEQADVTLTRTIQEEMPSGNYRESNDATWLLLDRATTRFAMGDVADAVEDYHEAIEALDYYNQDTPRESLGKVLVQDEIGAYQAADYEQVLARVYFALALLHQGDTSNAYAILRQAEEFQQRRRELYAQTSFTKNYQLVDNAVGKYLFATLLEKRGDFSNASILYRQACGMTGINLISDNNHEATVLILCHNGNAPYKISGRSDASVASAVALEIILSTSCLPPAWSSLGGVPTPALRQWFMSNPIPTFACLDEQQKPLMPWYNVTATAYEQLDQEMPVIVARAVARYIIRRSIVGYAQKQNPDLGAIVDFGMLVANLSTKADTRTWLTLPYLIDMNRFDVAAGQHHLTIQVGPYGFEQLQHFTLNLKPDDLCVINIFNIHPGITTIQIPQRFLTQ